MPATFRGIVMNLDQLTQTISYYDQNSEVFVSGTLKADMADTRSRFCRWLPQKALILDFGCGSGRDAKAFLEAGYSVEATDGSEELCNKASDYTGLSVKRMLFNELNTCNQYDGIWACASILHLPKQELADVLGKIETALKTGGVLYTSFKYGTFEGIRKGRYFTDFTEESLNSFWGQVTSMQIFDMWITHDVRPDREEERWINLLAQRV